jgi:hypothetical protein
MKSELKFNIFVTAVTRKTQIPVLEIESIDRPVFDNFAYISSRPWKIFDGWSPET